VTLAVTGQLAVTGDTVKLFNGASQVGITYALTDTDISNGFATVQTGPLTNGTTYNFTAKVGHNGNDSAASSPAFAVTEDTTPPVAPAITAISTDSGTVGDHITNDTTLTISGTTEANATVT